MYLQETELLKRVAELSQRLDHAESINAMRKVELQSLYGQFSQLTRILADEDGATGGKAVLQEVQLILNDNLIHRSSLSFNDRYFSVRTCESSTA